MTLQDTAHPYKCAHPKRVFHSKELYCCIFFTRIFPSNFVDQNHFLLKWPSFLPQQDVSLDPFEVQLEIADKRNKPETKSLNEILKQKIED